MRFSLGALVGILLIAAPGSGLGQDWELVRPDNTGMPGEEMRFLRFAPDGKLWVGARWPFWRQGGIGIHDFETKTWEVLGSIEGPLPTPFVNDVVWASDGTVFVGTGSGLLRFDGSAWTTWDSSNSPLVGDVVADLALDADGDLWINDKGADSALFEFDGTNWTKHEVGNELPWPLPWKELGDVLVASDGRVWTCNEVLDGLAVFDGSAWTLHDVDAGRFGELVEDAQGNIWAVASTGGGNAFWKFDGTFFSRYDSTNTPFVDTTVTTVAHEEGTVYVGNWFGQVIQTTDAGRSWTLFTEQNASIFDIEPDPSSTDVWVGTPGAARHLDRNGTWQRAFNSWNTGQVWYFVQRMTVDADGHIWFSDSEGGVSRFDGERWLNLGSHNPNRDWPILADGAEGVFGDSAGNVWIGTNGMARWDGTGLTVWDWRTSPQIGVADVTTFGEDGAGTIWAADGSTLFRFDGADWERVSVAGTEIVDIATDSTGVMWVAAWDRLHAWDGVAWSEVDHPDTFFELRGITALAIDENDVLWIGTNTGLVRWDGSSWSSFTRENSPLPAAQVQGVDTCPGGVVAVSAHEFGAVTPFPNGVALVDGPVEDPASWRVWTYADSNLRHYQLGRVKFDAAGDLWVSTISEATAVLRVGCNADADGDGNPDRDDCASLDPSVWAPAGEAGLLFARGDERTLEWSPPADPGGDPDTLRHDLLRSPRRDDFTGSARCIETDDASDTRADDPETPGLGGVFYYLVRAENPCGSSEGSLGHRSDGIARAGRPCP